MNLRGLKHLVEVGDPPTIEVHAFEQIIYQPFERHGDALQPLQDGRGRALKFPSRYKALQALANVGLESVEFVHRSCYGEMIGTSEELQETEFRQTVKLAHLR